MAAHHAVKPRAPFVDQFSRLPHVTLCFFKNYSQDSPFQGIYSFLEVRSTRHVSHMLHVPRMLRQARIKPLNLKEKGIDKKIVTVHKHFRYHEYAAHPPSVSSRLHFPIPGHRAGVFFGALNALDASPAQAFRGRCP